MAVGGGGGAEAMAAAHDSHYRLYVGHTVLQCTLHPQKAGCEPLLMDMQPIPKEGAVEVHTVFEELLLFEAVSEYELAYRA